LVLSHLVLTHLVLTHLVLTPQHAFHHSSACEKMHVVCACSSGIVRQRRQRSGVPGEIWTQNQQR
jgi:hypothetical protein